MQLLQNNNISIRKFTTIILFALSLMFVFCFLFVSVAFAENIINRQTSNNIVLATDVNLSQTSCKATLSGVDKKMYNSVQFAVWSDNSKQKDIKWFNAIYQDQYYIYDIQISQFGQFGNYFVDAYGYDLNGIFRFLSSSAFNITKPTCQQTTIGDFDYQNHSFQVNSIGVSSDSGIKNAAVAVWSDANGQDDIKWYEMNTTAVGNGLYNYSCSVDINLHSRELGVYHAHVYVNTINGINCCVDTISKYLTIPFLSFNPIVSSDEKTCNLMFETINLSSDCKIWFAVWSDSVAQSDLSWYRSLRSGNLFSFDVNIKNHRNFGTYYADAYFEDSNTKVVVSRVTFTIHKAVGGEFSVTEKDYENYRVSVTASNFTCISGVEQVKFAVWTDSFGQDDLRWYSAKAVSVEDKYNSTCVVDLRNHNLQRGLYYFDVYVLANNGVYNCIGRLIENLQFDVGKMTETLNDEQTFCKIWLDYPGLPADSYVSFAVWSEVGKQADLYWYKSWQYMYSYAYDVPIINHKQFGKYLVDAYCFVNGSSYCICSGSFDVTKPSADGFVYDFDSSLGTFNSKIENINCPSGVDSVRMASWSNSGGWTKAVWLDAELKDDKSYVSQVDVCDHDFDFGDYRVDVYLKAKNGIYLCIASLNANIQPLNYVGVKYIGNGIYNVCAAGLSAPDVVRVGYPTWSEPGGQDDLQWYYTTNSDGLRWKGQFTARTHWPAGMFITDFYAYNSLGEESYIRGRYYYVPEEAVASPIQPLYGNMFGVDVSEHNGDINWYDLTTSRTVGYAMIRAGFGVDREDYKFAQNYIGARSWGLPVGAYWYSYARNENEAVAEAYRCLEVLGGRYFDLPIAFDLEEYPEIDAWTNTAMINAFSSVIASAGYIPMVYASESWYQYKMYPDYIPNNIYFWVAKWSVNPPIVPKQSWMRMWQKSSDGVVPGIPSRVDVNYLYY